MFSIVAIKAVDHYRARRAGACSQCLSDAKHGTRNSASLRVRDAIVSNGLGAGLALFVTLAMGRFERGGW